MVSRRLGKELLPLLEVFLWQVCWPSKVQCGGILQRRRKLRMIMLVVGEAYLKLSLGRSIGIESRQHASL